MEKFSRLERRQQSARLKAKRTKSYWGRDRWAEDEMSPRQAGMVLNTAAICSCPLCGNPRKWFGERKLKERVQLIALREDLAGG